VLDLVAVVDELWKNGVGPDDRPRIQTLMDELLAPGTAAGRLNAAVAAASKAGIALAPTDPAIVVPDALAEQARRVTDPAIPVPIANATPGTRTELAIFYAFCDLMSGTPVAAPNLAEGPPSSLLLSAAAAVWSAAIARDVGRLERTLAELERRLAISDEGPRAAMARAWADLALGEAALVAADRTSARHRLEAVARGAAPVPLRIAATLRIVTLLLERADLDQARTRCRQAATIADTAQRPMHGQQARITGALLDFIAGDAASARRTLRAEAEKGPLGLLPRVLLSSFEPPERALPLLAEGLAEAGQRGDPFAFTMCTLVGARRYVALDRDADAILVLTTAIHQLQAHAPSFAATLAEERAGLQKLWGDERYASAEQAAIALLDGRS
jgi:hypothetical protein